MTEKLVMPGEVIKTKKKPGAGVYEENGALYAAVTGTLVEGDEKVTVEAGNPLNTLQRGDEVIVTVESVKEKIVLVKIMKTVGKQRSLPDEPFGVIRVMDIAPRYTEKASDEFKVGDIVKAEIAQIVPNDVIMTTKNPNLGVIEGYCEYDRGLLRMEGDKLVCTICGKTNRRKTSSDYLLKKEE